MFNLDLIAQDLLYYGYSFTYFVENYGKGLNKDFLRKIWNKQIENLERI